MSKGKGFRPDVVVVTALPVESVAVRSYFEMTGGDVELKSGFRVYEGKRSCAWGAWSVGVLEIGAGNVNSARATTDVLAKFTPKLIVFCGIGGSRKADVPIGSVVVPDHVYFYESGKEREAGFAARPRVIPVLVQLTQIAIKLRQDGSWTKLLPASKSKRQPEVIVKPLASGEVVVASTEGPTEQILQLHYDDAQAVEMEGYGLMSAAGRVPAFVVRGISDNRMKGGSTEPSNQKVAAKRASAMAVAIADEFLKGRLRRRRQQRLADSPELEHHSKDGRKRSAPGVKLRADSARSAADDSQNQAPAGVTADEALELGVKHRREGRHAEALAHLDRAIHVSARLALTQPPNGDVYHLLHRCVRALWDLVHALNLEPAGAEVFWLRGDTYRMLGRLEPSLSDLKLAGEYSSYPRPGIRLRWSLAQVYRMLGRTNDFNLREALGELKEVLELDPDNVNALVSRAEVNRIRGHPEEALKDLNQALQRDRDSFGALFNRGEVYRILNLPDAALKDINRVLENEPNNTAARGVRGAVYRMLGRSEEALKDLDKVVERWPDRVVPLLIRGEVYRTLGRHDKALKDFDAALALEPKGSIAFDVRRGVYTMIDVHDEALTDLERALQPEPGGPQAFVDRASVYALLGRGEEALKDLEDALEAEPESVRAVRVRASVYHMLNRNDEALKDLDRALQTEPDNASALLSRCDVNDALGNTEEALKDIDRVLALQPDSVQAVLRRADLYGKTKQWAEKLRDLDRAAELDPTRAETFWARGGIYRRGTDESVRDYQRALELEPVGHYLIAEPTGPIDHVTSALYIAQHDLLNRRGRKFLESALKDLNLALQSDPNHALALGARGRIYMALQQHGEAIRDFERAHELDPTIRWVKTHLEAARRARAPEPWARSN